LNTESCLSFPGISKIVNRYREIKISTDNFLAEQSYDLNSGRSLMVIQHEYQHCCGITIYDATKKIGPPTEWKKYAEERQIPKWSEIIIND
jgi:peptide deformylase